MTGEHFQRGEAMTNDYEGTYKPNSTESNEEGDPDFREKRVRDVRDVRAFGSFVGEVRDDNETIIFDYQTEIDAITRRESVLRRNKQTGSEETFIKRYSQYAVSDPILTCRKLLGKKC